MSSRPIYRWKLFWLGLLAMASLGYGWWNSMRTLRCVRGPCVAAIQAGGGVSLAFDSNSKMGWSMMKMDEPYHLQMDEAGSAGGTPQSGISFLAEKTMPPAERPVMVANGGVVTIFLPYWLILLVFFFPWAGLLAWRMGRQRGWMEAVEG